MDDEFKSFLFEDFSESEILPKKKKNIVPEDIRKAGLTIKPFPTNKHQIKQRPSMKQNIIPRHASAVIFNGKSGSGKSNLMLSMMVKPELFGIDKTGKHYFDEVYLFSPTAHGGDDLVKFLELKEDNISTDFDIDKLEGIIDKQMKDITQKGLLKTDKICIIFDDIQSDARFMRSKSFLKCFIQCRHLNISTFLCGQSFNLTPRACRLQANNIFFFPGSLSEMKVLVEEFTPPKMSKKDFEKLVHFATADPFCFLHINMREPPKTRFRKCLDTILELNV